MTCMFCGAAGSQICNECKELTGVREMPPPRRRRAPCTRCNHPQLIRVIPRELSVYAVRGGSAFDTNLAEYAPMYATYPVSKQRVPRVFSPDDVVVAPPQTSSGVGMFETYICKQCGFTEWYCHDPETIPIGPRFMTEDFDCSSDAPYR